MNNNRKILILDPYRSVDYRISKDTSGGYGTGNNFGNSIIPKFLKRTLKKISEWPKCVEVSSEKLEPHRISVYLYELASEFHSYWNMGKEDVSKRFIDQDNKIKMEKLVFLKSIANTLKTGMNILGVDTPEKM